MKKRRLGLSDLHVTEIGLGANAVGGHNLYEDLSEDDGIAVVQKALEVGINFIDTADVYGLGRSEELIGRSFPDPAENMLIATKGGNEWDLADPTKRRVNNRPEYLRRALEASLTRLRRDVVDLYYIHRVDDTVPLCDSFGELMRLKEEGKIRAAGLSNVNVVQLQAALCAGPIDAVQNEYNIFLREPERDVIPFCEDNDIAFIPYGPLAYGILGGRYQRDLVLPPGDWRNRVKLFSPDNFARVLDLVDQLKKIAAPHDAPVAHLAARWLLRRPFVASAIIGAKRPEQVADNANAVGWDLDADELDIIDELTAHLRLR